MARMVVMAELMIETPMKEMAANTRFTRMVAPAVNCVVGVCVCGGFIVNFIPAENLATSELPICICIAIPYKLTDTSWMCGLNSSLQLQVVD